MFDTNDCEVFLEVFICQCGMIANFIYFPFYSTYFHDNIKSKYVES